MGADTAIEWTDATWNPMRGCTRASKGCRNCYAETVAARFSNPGQPYHGFADRTRSGSKWTGKVEIVWSAIDLPLRWTMPRRIFVNSMSDFFHPALPAEELATVYATAVAAHHLRGHTLQILTKHPDRAAALMNSAAWWDQVNAEAGALVMEGCSPHDRRSNDARATHDDYGPSNPPPGIWLGTSVENQAAADERIPHLLRAPAATRFVSCEPLLGPVDLTNITGAERSAEYGSPVHGWSAIWKNNGIGRASIDWVISGGESGPHARPMHPDWARGLRDQCADAGVPFFFKQWGEFAPQGPNADAWMVRPDGSANPDPLPNGIGRHTKDGFWYAYRVGKKAAGALLDGVEHRAFPDA